MSEQDIEVEWLKERVNCAALLERLAIPTSNSLHGLRLTVPTPVATPPEERL